MSRRCISVLPAGSTAHFRRLLAALELAFPVRFQEPEDAVRVPDAILVLAADELAEQEALAFPAPALVLSSASPRRCRGLQVRFALSSHLDSPLRGQELADSATANVQSAGPSTAGTVLAEVAGLPIWIRERRGGAVKHRVGVAVQELTSAEVLRDQLRAGRFIGLLPLVQFLRDLTAEERGELPPLRASFIIDDPNLHATSYGHLNYAMLAREAQALGFHVGLATIPLDAWFVYRPAAELLRRHGAFLSLLIHGNNHLHHELARPMPAEAALSLAAQALVRARRLAKRSGLSVAPIMVAPHGACSETMTGALLRTGFEALCMSRPYPWRDAPPPERLLAGWEMAELVSDGFPILPRYPLRRGPAEIVLRAFLRQPLILYGHHDDLATGLGPLAEWTERINRLGPVAWGSIARIVRAGYTQRRAGDELLLHLWSRHVKIVIPAGIRRLVVRMGSAELPGSAAELLLDGDRVDRLTSGGLVGMSVTAGRHVLELRHPETCDPETVALPRTPLWAVLRRGLTEGRDRLMPQLRR